ncbi:fungal-specific transcription factor domain-containing protein [Exophiala viscosa]|uniref:Fungal-specific transcription factor domain-containing protein n=1 Tax=Exophiala viscosa TaxID=2486360 RepID=A0AAN6E0Z9_9EURO|nr:fungal-specific transcription factor domain-containing protein [Exophiala viscosa]
MAAMVSASPRDPTEVKFRRTNSLAFAKSDCHTCSSLSLHCDRQRPRCTPCQNAGILCQGYSMKLTWHQNHSMVNRPPKVKSVPIPPQESSDVSRKGSIVKEDPVQKDKSPGSPTTPEQGRQFMFVAARPPKRRKKNHQSMDAGATVTPRPRASSKTAIPGVTGKRPARTPASEGARRPSNVTVADTPLTDIAIEEPIQLPSLPDVGDFNLDPALKDDPTESIPWQHEEFNWVSPPCQTPSAMIDFESLEQCLEIQRQPLPLDMSDPSPTTSTQMSMSLDLSRDLWPEEWTDESPGGEQDLIMHDKNGHFVDMIPQLCYSTLTDKFYGLLDMYDQEFCRYPITNHFAVNPYRYRPETTRGSQHLLHAIVALSCHFRLRSATQPQPPADAVDHKNTAVVLYQGALSKKDIHLHGLSMLDTAMALWQFEATISALNIWRSHLSDAYNLLELCGGVSRWSASIKANTQVSMFLWWDGMVSLLAREDPVFPYSYFEAVLKSEGRQPWTFYELNGCPRELLVPMMQLSTLAARDAQSTTPSESVLDIVTEIELSIRRYEYSGAGLSDLVFEGIDTDENDLHIERDRYHCCEAFRYALLIYILRVFTMRRVLALEDETERERERKRVRSRLSFLARVALEHVASCRPDDDIQKQVLFPLFVAGAETRHIAHRDIVREYCASWYGRFGYQMFNTVGEVLEVVWQKQDAGDEMYWWGEELDSRRAVEGDHVQFCFG